MAAAVLAAKIIDYRPTFEWMESLMQENKIRRAFVVFSHETTMMLNPPEREARQSSRVEDYLRKTAVLRQIMSNKSRKYRSINYIQNFLTVVISALLAFLGFSGAAKLTTWVSWVIPISADVAELGLNFLVFILFVIGILHLVFHFPDKQAKAEQAVAALAALSNEIEDTITTRGNLVISEDNEKISLIRVRYEAIAQSIPANSDREFQRAKRDLARKEAKKPRFYLRAEMLFDEKQQESIVSAIILGSRTIVDVLIALRETDKALYLGGGLVRNAVWDYLHGYRSPTPVDDVDVIYFDEHDKEKRHDEDLNLRLVRQIPNIHWSAKNQARMHIPNNEQPYRDLADAVARWPETATAMIVRLNDDATLDFIAPYGFDDLVRLVIRNTPAFSGREDFISRRISEKRWKQIWPKIQVVSPKISTLSDKSSTDHSSSDAL